MSEASAFERTCPPHAADEATMLRSYLDYFRATVLASPEGLDLQAKVPRHGKHATVRWILVHMVEEYARHAGHADLIREAVDARTDL